MAACQADAAKRSLRAAQTALLPIRGLPDAGLGMAEGEDENAAPPPASKEEAAVGKAMDNLAGGVSPRSRCHCEYFEDVSMPAAALLNAHKTWLLRLCKIRVRSCFRSWRSAMQLGIHCGMQTRMRMHVCTTAMLDAGVTLTMVSPWQCCAKAALQSSGVGHCASWCGVCTAVRFCHKSNRHMRLVQGTEKAMDSSKADAAVAKLQETRAKEKADLKKR